MLKKGQDQAKAAIWPSSPWTVSFGKPASAQAPLASSVRCSENDEKALRLLSSFNYH